MSQSCDWVPFNERDPRRTFSAEEKTAKFREQRGKCGYCGLPMWPGHTHGDHDHPWSRGGKTVLENLVVMHPECNSLKSDFCAETVKAVGKGLFGLFKR